MWGNTYLEYNDTKKLLTGEAVKFIVNGWIDEAVLTATVRQEYWSVDEGASYCLGLDETNGSSSRSMSNYPFKNHLLVYKKWFEKLTSGKESQQHPYFFVNALLEKGTLVHFPLLVLIKEKFMKDYTNNKNIRLIYPVIFQECFPGEVFDTQSANLNEGETDATSLAMVYALAKKIAEDNSVCSKGKGNINVMELHKKLGDFIANENGDCYDGFSLRSFQGKLKKAKEIYEAIIEK